MLSDIAQKIEYTQLCGPVQIISNNSCVFSAVKIDKLADLSFDLVDPTGDNIRRIQLTLCRLKAWITNQTSCTAHKSNWTMACLLETL